MVKEELVNISGKDIKIKAISFIDQINIWTKENKDFKDTIKCCLNKEDFEYLEQLEPNPDEQVKFLETLNRVNGWEKKKVDFHQPKPEEKS